MLEGVETVLAAQRQSFAALREQLLARNAAGGSGGRLSRYLAAAEHMAIKPLRVGIVGELNAGKTELANLILGLQLLPTSVINNSRCPAIIRYGEAHAVRQYRDKARFEETDASELHRLVQREAYRVECVLPLPLLRSIEIADMPAFEAGTLATSRIAPLLADSEVLIWCSRATKAWTASEHATWLQLPKRLKAHCLLVLTHADKLRSEALDAVAGRIETEMPAAGAKTVFLATSLAIEARSPRGQIMNPKLWTASGGERFFQKLSELLQSALTHRQSRIQKNTNRLLSSVLDDPSARDGSAVVREWIALAPVFAYGGDATSPDEKADAVIEAVTRFKREVFEPWLRLHDRAEEDIRAIMRLLPESPTELGAPSRHRLAERLPLIFQQLKAELEECGPSTP
jgi:hypothetical protein